MASTPLVMTDFTNNISVDADNVVTGTGIFDDMMEGVTAHIKAQYDAGTINGADYASVYLGALQYVIQSSTKIFLDKGVVAEQIETEKAKAALVTRQMQGFDNDAKQKLLKQVLDSWSVAFSVSQDAISVPDSIKVDTIDSILRDALESLSILPVDTTPAVVGVYATASSKVFGDLDATAKTQGVYANGFTITIATGGADATGVVVNTETLSAISITVETDGAGAPDPTWNDVVTSINLAGVFGVSVATSNGTDTVVSGDAEVLTLANGVDGTINSASLPINPLGIS